MGVDLLRRPTKSKSAAGHTHQGDFRVTGDLEADGEASTVTIAIAASDTTDGMDITVTVKNAQGATVEGVHELTLIASDADTGIGLTADSFSGDLTAVDGAILGALTAKKAWRIQTAADGVFTGTLVDSANPADVYIAVKRPGPIPGMVVSEVSGTNWEGAGE